MNFELTPDQEALKDTARRAGEEWQDSAEQWDVTDEAPMHEITRRFAELSLLGLTMPKQYGGQQRTILEYALCAEEIIHASGSSVCVEPLFRTSGAGPTLCLMADEEEPRRAFLPAIISGEVGCALALTEPQHGSDISYLETSARRDGDDYVINGAKRFITGAPTDDLYATFVRFGGTPGARGVGTIMVQKGTPGFEVDRGHRFVGGRGVPHGNLYFRDCRVPAANVLAREGRFAEVMRAFNMERIHNAACGLGLSQRAFDEASKYAQARKQFGRPIIEFQAVYHALADMWVKIEALRFLVYRAAATAVGGNYPQALDVTVAKRFASETLWEVSTAALEIHGGDGTRLDYAVQRIHRDAMIHIIAGGTRNIVRNVIAGQLFPHRRFRQTVEDAAR